MSAKRNVVWDRTERVCGMLLLAVGSGLFACGGSTHAASTEPKSTSAEAEAAPADAKSPVADFTSSEPAAAAPAAPAAKPSAPAHSSRSGRNGPAPSNAAALQSKPASEAPAQPKALRITLRELADRRDLWPSKVKLTKRVGFSPTEVYPAGKEMELAEIAGNDLHLDSGNGLIEVPAASTDVLERASELMASLSPEQLALTAQMLPTKPELWPTELTITKSLGFSNGSKVPAGRKVLLRAFQGDQVNVFDREFKNYYTAAINETDVIARARERVKLPEKEREPFFGRSVAAACEAPAGGTLPKADYVLVYQARLGCGRCAQFLPALEKFYDRMKPAHPEFEAVFVSADFNAGDMKTLQEREKLPGVAVAYDKRLEAAELGTLTQNGELLPLVYLYDRNGKMVTRCQGAGGKPTAEDVLAVLEKKLGEKK
jgi:hypothetical protein